jgi:DNA-binding CsgD family transcriptional regulator
VLVHPASRRILEVSDAAVAAVGISRPRLLDGSLDQILAPAVLDDTAMGLLRSRVDGYWTRASIRRGDGGSFTADLVVRTFDYGVGRLLLLVLAVPGQLDSASVDPPQPVVGSRLALGDVDSDWRVAHVSPDIAALLGHSPDDVIGTPLLAAVHPADLPDLLAAIGKAAHRSAGEWVQARLRVRGGSWRRCVVMVAPLAAGPDRTFAFAVGAAATDVGREPAERLAELERRLWTIGRELRAAGVLRAEDQPDTTSDLPGVEKLSPREWEVLTHVRSGRRATAIAKALVLSPSTVRNHLTSIYQKLGVRSHSELVELLHAHGLTASWRLTVPTPPGCRRARQAANLRCTRVVTATALHRAQGRPDGRIGSPVRKMHRSPAVRAPAARSPLPRPPRRVAVPGPTT